MSDFMENELIQGPSFEEVNEKIRSEFGDKVTFKVPTKKNIRAINEKRRVFISTDRETIFELCKYIHDTLNFEQATSVCAVDYVDHIQIVYHLTNYFTGIMIEISVNIPNEDLHIPSVSSIWEGANWHERETYELFGVIFDGHPKLERLLTSKDYEFYPFRKSYKLRGAK
ncbi:MAG: NADH-quinone oxidoreductase subunit C [archaeon]|nr:NADH-quinone oxidoreductase subunit C [archaeon]